MPDNKSEASDNDKTLDQLKNELDELRSRVNGLEEARRKQKEAEDALKESQRFLSTLISNLPGMVYRCRNDKDFTMEFVSEGCYQITGYLPSDLIHNNKLAYNDLIHPEDQEHVWTNIQKALEKHEPYRIIYRIKTATGKEKWVWEQGRGVYSFKEKEMMLEGFITDITERKKFEEELKLDQFLVDKAADAIFLVDIEGNFHYVNDAACNSLGYTCKELQSLKVWDIDPLFTKERWPSHWKEIEIKSPCKFESEHKTKGGRIFPVEVSVYKFTFHDEDFHCAFVRDISRRKKAEKGLKESEEKYRRIVQDQTELICRFTPDLLLTFVNDAYARYFEKTKEELLGKNFLPLVEPEDRQLVIDTIYSLSPENPLKTLEERVVLPDGKIKWMQWINHAFFNEKGEVIEYQAVGRDMTEHKEYERFLKCANEYNRSLIESSLDPLVTISPDGKITDVNAATEKITGFAREELIGTDFSDYFLDPEKAREGYRIAFKTGSVKDYSLEIRHKDGHITPVVYNASVYRDESGEVIGVFAAARDVTELRMAEDALKLASAYNRSLIEASLDPLVTISPEGKITDVNIATEIVTGYSRDELIGTDFSDYFTDPEMAREGYRKAFKEGLVKDYRLEIRHRDGHITPVLYNASVYLDEYGNVIGVFAAARDMAERDIVERALKLANAYNRSLIEASLDPLVTISPGGKITDVNMATEKVTGYSRDELIGTDFSDYFMDPGKAREGYRKAFKEGFVTDYRLEIRHRDGHIIPVLYNASVYRDEYGNVIGVFAAARDMTERDKVEKALRESEERYRSIGELIPYGVWITGPDGGMEYLSRSFLEMAGKTMEECKGYGWMDILTPEDRKRTKNDWKMCMDTACFWDYEYSIIGADGKCHILLSRGVPIRDEKGDITSWVGINLDITQRKRTEEELKEAKAQSELYVDLMGHDINNLNQIAMGYLEMALDILKTQGILEKDNMTMLEKPIEMLRSNSKLIENVKKIQRERTGQIKPMVMDLGVVLQDVVKQYAEIPGREITINYIPVIGCYVLANELIKDVFSNLVGNAIKHSTGPLTINIILKKVCDMGREYYKVMVEDNGPGIPDDIKTKLFERLSLARTRESGKGFGLCLIKILVDDYNGRFWVEDRVEGDYTKGCRFVVMLPVYETKESSSAR
ncbi:hypothetical protein CUJ83_02480 [Methanocella sp. CWC-04]|uniref:histidine kinase n=1 Tax=Methanooceanicella nereidis TaxID=2052831 RepID=A0AAP2W632_9EURY|nr:PAS domain S-box protein [Methanocella sp. CWC-04]MCD1293864.1 hypothetical protein [Methanocella sp. CWC-04]